MKVLKQEFCNEILIPKVLQKFERKGREKITEKKGLEELKRKYKNNKAGKDLEGIWEGKKPLN